ncbi:MAG TPA: hypothetical protein VFD26_07525 [Methyloceanibacter sp.]|nr:hypothetical protein [Methyloceanibacter sp.]
MKDRIEKAQKMAEDAFEAAALNAVAISGMRLLLPFAIAGRIPTSEELSEVVGNLVPPHVERFAPDEAAAVREWIFAVIADSRAVAGNGRN